MATKKPSPAQVAARKRFAEMARAGVFAKRAGALVKRAAKAVKRAVNPARRAAPTRKSNPVPLNQLFGVKLNAGNDRNGNPRRGWIVCEILDGVEARPVGFVDEGFDGASALARAYGDIPSVGVFDVSPKDYAHMKKQGPVWVRIGRHRTA